MSHTHIKRDERVALAQLLWAGKTQAQVAARLGKSPSAISREISRNKDEDDVYRGSIAHTKVRMRRVAAKAPARKIENDRKLRRHVVRKTKQYWSPEQIAGRLKRVMKRTIISHEAIYQFIYQKRPDLWMYLRCRKGRYQRKRGTLVREKARDVSKIRCISERPSIVDDRGRIGDWEEDTVIGGEKKQRIQTCVERMSGLGLADKLDSVSAEIVHKKSLKRFKRIPKSKRHTLTRDNGTEFGDWDRELEKRTGVRVYRAHPYHSWERGTNENWNGLLRQFFPKKTFFASVTQADVDRAVRLLNNRPRKRLGYLTPREVFNGRCVSN